MRDAWRKTAMLLAVSAGLALAAPAAGQTRGKGKSAGKAPARAARVEEEPAGGAGLDALSDDALMAELAGRQMQGLLEHAFEVNKVPPAQRQAMLALPAIARLNDPKFDPKMHERLQLVAQIAAGAEKVVASIDDPAVLMQHSTTLVTYGVDPDIRLLEYWGDSRKVQNRLKPVVAAATTMLDKAIATGTKKRAKLEDQLEGRNDRIEKAWTEIDNLVNTAEYTRAALKYHEAMAVPATAKGLVTRTKLADEALEYLAAYDNADGGQQADVRIRMAKLMMVKRDYGPANDLLETVVSGQVDEKTKIEPPPQLLEQYEARYFSAVAEMLQGDLDRAKKGVDEIVTWQKANVQDKAYLEQLDAAAEMLRYRILMKERDKLKDPSGKKAAEDAAFAILFQLNEQQPALRGIIAEQLIEAMGDKVDVKDAKILILQALVNRGGQAAEAIEDPKKADPVLVRQVEQAVEAGREVMVRKDPSITPAVVADVARKIPVFYERLGRAVEAANGYMDFIEKKQGSAKQLQDAYQGAGYQLSQAMKDPAVSKDAAFTAARERFLPIAIDQFGRTDMAFEYATRLRLQNPPQYETAVQYFRKVAAKSKAERRARYLEMLTLNDWIYAVGPDKKPLLAGEQRTARVQETLKVAEDVKRLAAEAEKQAKDPAAAQEARNELAGVILTQAEIAGYGDKPDARRIIEVLKGFEQQSQGLPNAAPLNKRAMELRVAAYILLNEFQPAADELVKLLEKEPNAEKAADQVLGILEKLNDDYSRAMAAGDNARAKQILESRASLSGYLVKWAAGNKKPELRKNLYQYTRYDADTQRLFAAAAEEPARTAGLKKAMAAFQALRTPANVTAYKTMVEDRKKANLADKTDPDAPDAAVTLGMALTSYDLKDWQTASKELKKLRFGGRIGNRQREEINAKTGESRVVPNDQYWEAMYKYYNATYQWALAEPENADAQAELGAVKTLMKRDYVAGADDVGGVKWSEPFEALRKLLIPDLDLKSLKEPAAGGGSPAPASQPAEPEVEKAAEPVAAGAGK